MNKKEVYFNEYNILMSNTTYLPIVSGLLQAYANTEEVLQNNFEYMPFLFHVDNKQTILDQYNDPAVAAFSVSMWNEQLNIRGSGRDQRYISRLPYCLRWSSGSSLSTRLFCSVSFCGYSGQG